MSAAAAARRRKARNALERCPGYEPNPMFAYLERCKNCGFAKAEHTVIKSEGTALTSYLDPAQVAREKEERQRQLERAQQQGNAGAEFSYLKVDEQAKRDAQEKAAKAQAAAKALAEQEEESKRVKEALAAAKASRAKNNKKKSTTTATPTPPVADPKQDEDQATVAEPEPPASKEQPEASEAVVATAAAAAAASAATEVLPTPLPRGDTQASLTAPADTTGNDRGSMVSLATTSSVALADGDGKRRSAQRVSARASRFLSGRFGMVRAAGSIRSRGSSSTLSRRQNRLTKGKGPRDVKDVRAAHLQQISRLMKVTTREAAQARRQFRKYEEPSTATLQLLASEGGRVRWRSNMSIDWTKLHVLAWNRDAPALEKALRSSALLRDAVDAPAGDTGETALSLAAKRGSEPCAFALLSAGADANTTDHFGLSPAHYAARAGATELLKMLAQAGADLRSGSSELGLSVMHVACRYADAATVAALLQEKVPIDPVDMRGWTPLFYAVLRPGQRALAEQLVAAGADTRHASPEGLTGVHCASLSDDPEQVGVLVENGARMDSQDADGWTPVHYCARYNCARALQRLFEYGARPKPRSDAPFTPFEVASHFECAEALAALENARGFEPQKIVLDADELDEEPVLGKYVRMDEELDLAELQTIREVLEYADGASSGGGDGCCVVS